MAKYALLVRLDAKTGKEAELESLLQSALALVQREPGTRSWYALRMAPQVFGIFDTFDSQQGREDHLTGQVATALRERAPELLSRPPIIEKVDILAAQVESERGGKAG